MAANHEAHCGPVKAVAAGLATPRASLLDEPLDYILADHFRERCLCAGLRKLANELPISREYGEAIIHFLTKELPLHHQDEDEDLYPLLRHRCRAEDELGTILEQLTLDHKRSHTQSEAILQALPLKLKTNRILVDRNTREIMHSYAAEASRHVAIENGIVLVIARKRLKPSDIDRLSKSMKARRGLGYQ